MEARVTALKQVLNNTDYKTIKASEGAPSSDWKNIKVKRQAWREKVNELENSLAEGAYATQDE